MPSSRSLAASLSISRGVVLEAYAQLTAEGYLSSSQGAPTRVAAVSGAERPPVAASMLEPNHEYELDPALPDLAGFPRDRWVRSLRTVLRLAPFDALGHGDPRGAPELRNELLGYLSRVRGAAPEPEHTVICAGFTQGFALLCRTLRDRGLERIALEDPGWAQHRLIAAGTGLEPVGIAVDELGIDVSELAASRCEAVVVTPAHQFPTGVVLASERRAELLEWAEDADALIIEDDYDSELRYDRDPVGSLQGLAPERVCHLGSASVRLSPGLRLGWMLSPSWLTGALTYEKGVADGGSPAIEQLALADFIARGELDRHLRRMRLEYRSRREALLASLLREVPDLAVTGIAAGLYTLALLPDGVRESEVISAAAARGVGLEGLAGHRLSGGGPEGLLLGYANLPAPALQEAVRRLATSMR
jgi:GntR family transcriptional regulator/MocR family aminotransferase